MQMTPHDRLMAALRGEEVDRLPWSPNLAYWWDTQPEDLQDRGRFRFLKEIGADPLIRGSTTAFVCSDVRGLHEYPTRMHLPIPGCETLQLVKGREERTTYCTPVGTLTQLSRYSPEGRTRFLVERPVKTAEDYQILTYLFERMVIRPDYGPVKESMAHLGQEGLLIPLISPVQKTPFQALVEHYVGTQQLVYDLADHPDVVESLLEVMSQRVLEAVMISAESPAEGFISWEDSSTTNISPKLFARYIAPEIDRWGQVLHAAGKILLHHACGHVRHLLLYLAEEEIDVVESLSPPPTGDVEVWEAQEILSPRVGIVGGIEPTQLLYLDLEHLGEYVERLLDRIQSHHYVLANSDSCPPGVSIEKFRLITEIVRNCC
jgi:uroporphyrinogen-III decarboxylase